MSTEPPPYADVYGQRTGSRHRQAGGCRGLGTAEPCPLWPAPGWRLERVNNFRDPARSRARWGSMPP
ncbi:hypothetical protein GCM10010324_44220 [Streptomyces hiroshimensis]|uniref:Uncharacterized protein n=1 Tax=Streptomyces hiroshimensis TaxID=66424 RepID=A0ABQ2YV67_9ACTN|nr:hypothetical protein GCM10010324_44220 [Streptomyces hiroshimensis]